MDRPADLDALGFDAAWWARASPDRRRVLLLLRRALIDVDLWSQVEREWDSGDGTLQVRVRDVAALRAALDADPRFGPVRTRGDAWSCRGRGYRGALHVKHFKGWDAPHVQFHLDPWGLLPRSVLGWLVWPVMGPLHVIDFAGYLDVRRVAESVGQPRGGS
jgi:hypothetical protein